LLLDNALGADELRAAQAGVAEHAAADEPGELWCFNKDLEALVFHRSFWPIVMELTNGKPKMKGAQFINDDPVKGTGATNGKGGGHLHCARTDFGPESATFYQERGELRCNDMIIFIYLTEVLDGDGGLGVRACPPPPAPPPLTLFCFPQVLPGSHKVSRHDIAAIRVAFFSRCQRYRCRQDFFVGDDFHHNGAFYLPHAFNFLGDFGFGKINDNSTRADVALPYGERNRR